MIYLTYDRSEMVEVNGRLGFFQPQGETSFEIRRLAQHRTEDTDFGVVLENDADYTTWAAANPGLSTVVDDADAYFGDGWNELWTPRIWDQIQSRGWNNAPTSKPHERYQWLLARLKSDFYLAADRKTRELIAQGFEYPAASGQMFSLSPEAQMKWTAMNAARLALSYPLLVVTADEQTTVELADHGAAQDMFEAMVETVRGHIDSGRALKNAMRDDADLIDEHLIVAAAVDGR
jgi:hypothetical protein